MGRQTVGGGIITMTIKRMTGKDVFSPPLELCAAPTQQHSR